MFFVSSLSSQTVVQMTRSGGVSLIPCKVNGLNLNFVFDTGASDVSLSLTEAGFMLKNGYLAESDFVGTQNYSDANGDIEEGVVINLRSIIIGGLLIKNVQATIVKNTKAPLLLGQSALSRLGIVQQDFVKNTLTIYNNGSVPKAPPASVPPKPVTNKLEIVINEEDGGITKFSIVPLSRITTKPKPDIKYFWYNVENNTLENTTGDWGGPLLNGVFQYFDENGKLVERGYFVNGCRHGEFKDYDEDGILIKVNGFKSGYKIFTKTKLNRFVFDSFFDSIYIKRGYAWEKKDLIRRADTTFYFDESGKLYRKKVFESYLKIFEYWPNGKLRRKFVYIDNPTYHERFGEYAEWYENGILKVRGNYLKSLDYGANFLGQPTGTWIVNKKNGTLRNKIIFRRDSIYSLDKDTLFIGLAFHDKFSTDSIARIGWARIGTWYNIQNGEQYFHDYPFWRPESIDNYNYSEYLSKDDMYSDDGRAELEKMLIVLDDYSIVYSHTPHIFE